MAGSDLLATIVLNDLKEIGIKHKGKKPKIIKHSSGQRLFHQGLEHLKLTDAFLASGAVVQVPQFITEACSYILENSETEGIFRKAGSAAKQREIRKCLEAGQPLGKLYRVIDVANIVSYFFRELPEPLIPVELHETLVRCLMIGEPNRIRSIQLACLLITPLNVHTLAYFMQFLQTITRHVKYNKMSAENLAIVIAPSIMPYRDINSVRFKNHIKLVELLIKNSNIIGTIPAHIKEKLKNTSNLVQTKKTVGVHCSAIKSKMRRSHLFNGLKTMVGSSANATGHAHSPSKSVEKPRALHKAKSQQNCMIEPMDTSPRTSTNREAFTKSVSVLNVNEKRHRRLTLNAAANEGSMKPSSCPTTLSGTDRRWSLISTGWAKCKKKEKMLHNLNSSVSDALENKDPVGEIQSKLDPTISKREYDAITDRLATISTNAPQPKLSSEKIPNSSQTPLEQNNEKCQRQVRRSITKQYANSPVKLRTLQKSNTPTNIVRHKTWHLNSEAKFPSKLPIPKIPDSDKVMTDVSNRTAKQEEPNCEQWLPANIFFQNSALKENKDQFCTQSQDSALLQTPYSQFKNKNRIKTVTGPFKTPIGRKKSLAFGSAIHMFDVDQGRESIARLRTENAGMVLAKAKLFDDFSS
ncbi:uncharacterized protein LOC108649139 [Drosophila navojoa]|uniref:uncharacterized protein LOC108649139 n=1 Tax=Drosophila navojoa TaxID=7232 RepID=UPI0008472885|nr:uncharacterized protein LOC108649139 [Drosophila navojoa]